MRDPHRCVYSSSPDRGLQMLLDIWPRIREQVPDATLHILYGFDNWERALAMGGDAGHPLGTREAYDKLKASIEALKDQGVVYRGRVSKAELREEFCKSGVMLYPTWFSETSMIGAMEAQAAGLRIVYSPIAALNETIGDAGKAVPFTEYNGEQHQADFIAAAVEALIQEGWERGLYYEEDTAEGDLVQCFVPASDPSRFSLDTLAEDWDAMLLGMVSETETRVMPPYYPWKE